MGCDVTIELQANSSRSSSRTASRSSGVIASLGERMWDVSTRFALTPQPPSPRDQP